MSKVAVAFGAKCKDCKVVLALENAMFKGHYLQTRCKPCWSVKHASLPSRSTEARKAQYVEWKFGVTIEEFNRKVALQSGGCAICKKPCDVRKNLAIDHNHTTGAIRDLLCHRCNVVLGLVEEDELLFLEMIDYLKRHNQSKVA